jgi:hypothetical protein
MDLLEELTNLIARLKEEAIDFALCGGLAMAVYAFPRATIDIDIMIEADDLSRVRSVVGELGFSIDSGLMEFKGGAIKIHRLCKIVPESEDELVLDLLLVTPEVDEAWRSRREILWEKGPLPTISPEGLIHLKSLRGSGQDRDDIDKLRDLIDED